MGRDTRSGHAGATGPRRRWQVGFVAAAMLATVASAPPAWASHDGGAVSPGCQILIDQRGTPLEVADGTGYGFRLEETPFHDGDTLVVSPFSEWTGPDGWPVSVITRPTVAETIVLAEGTIESGVSYVFSATPTSGLLGMFVAAADGGRYDGTFTMDCVPAAPPDGDADGVIDGQGLCPGTVLPDRAARRLLPNRYETNAAGEFVDADGTVAATNADTGGCSARQIGAAAGLGAGEVRFGLTAAALRSWIASL